MELEQIAQCINTLGAFCGCRDVAALTHQALLNRVGLEQADVMVLFGGSILCGGDVLAEAMRNKAAKKTIIVGGAGHTTETLRLKMNQYFPEIATADLPEAEVFSNYLKFRYNLEPDYLERRSTNCGNNITYLLDLLNEHHVACGSIILCQDATMQRRMDAGLRKVAPNLEIINFAAYQAQVAVKDDKLVYAEAPWGMWELERYISLLMGEIPRLTDDARGYGPRGKNYIAHVDVPQSVLGAFELLKESYGQLIREANQLYASKT